MTSFDGSAPPPHSVEAEQEALGSSLLNATAFHRIAGIVQVEDFFREQHKVIFRAMGELAADAREIHLVSLKEELIRECRLEEAGGAAYIASLIDGIPDIANVEDYADIVKRYAMKRRLMLMGSEIRRLGGDPSEEPQDIAAWALNQLATQASGQNQARAMWDVSLDVERRRQASISEGIDRTIRIGFGRLDGDRILRRKALTIVAAPSSHGKTTMMRNFAVGALRASQRQRVAFYSLEESDEDFREPLLSQMSGVLLRRIQNGEMPEGDTLRLDRAVEEMRAFRDRFGFADRIRDFDSLHADCCRLKATGGLDVVFVDYLQLLRGFDETRERGEQRVAAICRGLLNLAQDLDVSVCAGSQVNKDRSKRPSGRLALEDMKYGAVIGEFAAVALMFQRPRQDDKSDKETLWCELLVQEEKNRARETGDVTMHADMPTQTFAEGTCEENNCRWNRPPSESQLKLGGK